MAKPTINILTDEELESVHLTSFKILEDVGAYLPSKEILRMLADNGAQVNYTTNIARFPRGVVKEYISKAPSEFTLAARDEDYNMNLRPGNFYFGIGSGAVRFRDVETGEARTATVSDFENLIKISDVLSNFSFVGEAVTPIDVPPDLAAQYMWASLLKHSRKHIHMYLNDPLSVRDGINMASAVVGSEEELVRKPIIDFLACIGQPLTFEKRFLEGFVEAAKHGIPLWVHSGAMAGATGPVTLAGTLALCNAEILGGITIAQMTRPGTPVIYTNWARIFDMKSQNVTFGSPEFAMLRIATGQLVRKYYRIPFSNAGFQTDSKLLDAQNGYDAHTTLIGMLAGSNLLLGSTIDGANMTDPLSWVINNELAAHYRQIIKGFRVDEMTLAFDIVKSVGAGPGHNFLATKHTHDHLREQHWLDYAISERRPFSLWEKDGSKDTRQRAKVWLQSKLKAYKPEPLSVDVQRNIDQVLEQAKSRSYTTIS